MRAVFFAVGLIDFRLAQKLYSVPKQSSLSVGKRVGEALKAEKVIWRKSQNFGGVLPEDEPHRRERAKQPLTSETCRTNKVSSSSSTAMSTPKPCTAPGVRIG